MAVQSRLAAGAALALVALALTARALALSRGHLVPVFDEVAYLDQARAFRALGGPVAVAACHLKGECREANRHPLYAMLAAPLTRDEPADFARLKLLTLACAWALTLAAFALGARRGGPGLGLVLAALVGLSPSLAYLSSRVLADVLFALLYLAALELLLERRWLGYGAVCGLAWLSKGTGHLLLIPGALLALRERRGRELALALAAFALVAAFLLARNLVLWGAPFYNINTDYLWFDDWPAVWRALDTPAWKDHGPAAYFKSHSLGQVLGRLLSGAAGAAGELVDAAGVGFPGKLANRASGALVLAAGAYGLARKPRALAVVLVPLALVFAALSFGRQITATGTRLFFPLALSVMPWAAAAVWDAAGRRTLPVAGTVAAAALLALAPAAWALRGSPLTAWTLPPDWAAAAERVRALSGERGFLVPYESVFSTWDRGRDLRRPYPFESPDEELRAALARKGVDVVVLDRALPSGARAGKSFLGLAPCLDSGRFVVFAERCSKP